MSKEDSNFRAWQLKNVRRPSTFSPVPIRSPKSNQKVGSFETVQPLNFCKSARLAKTPEAFDGKKSAVLKSPPNKSLNYLALSTVIIINKPLLQTPTNNQSKIDLPRKGVQVIDYLAKNDYFDSKTSLEILHLNLEHNRISDLINIGQFRNLKELHLKGNPIARETLWHLRKLKIL